MHHVLADGLAGIQLVTALTAPESASVTGVGAETPGPGLPAMMPSWPSLARDAWAARLRELRRAPSAARSLGPALRELGVGRGTRAPRSILNRRTGPRRCHATVAVPEASLRRAARSAGGSLNDAVLTVLADILAEQAAQRGEDLDPVVVSVPVAVRAGSAGSRTGRGDGAATNAVGVMPTPVPTRGLITDRIAAVAAWRHARLDRDGAGASLPLVLAAFRIVHALHLVRWYTDRQRLVTTFATALPGPALPVTLLGTPVTRITPLALNQGNTTIAFATITYAGQLTIGVVARPHLRPGPGRTSENASANVFFNSLPRPSIDLVQTSIRDGLIQSSLVTTHDFQTLKRLRAAVLTQSHGVRRTVSSPVQLPQRRAPRMRPSRAAPASAAERCDASRPRRARVLPLASCP